jgi:cellulose synthase/poly-beta-1,6-N-acetylglucosamine synthase-like glycosyltransferase
LITLTGNNITDWIYVIYLLIAAVQLVYLWLLFGRFAFSRQASGKEQEFPVSVVLSAKNEYHNLKKNLPAFLKQEYPKFEVVVVNDASDDETIFLLEDMARAYSHLKVVTISQNLNFFRGKKFPLALGIKSAKYDHLLLTDADCTPAGPQWIRRMTAGFYDGKEVVLGYGKYFEAKGFLNRIIRYDTAFIALQYYSLALWGSPYMGIGRNLAYRKKLLLEHKGFTAHYKVSSGDDDLFINQVANKKNTFVQSDPGSFTTSPSKETFQTWWAQKRRHLTTGRYYKFKHKLILGGYPFSLLLFYACFALILILGTPLIWALLPLIIRIISQLIVLHRTFNKLQERKLLLISPVIELIITLIYPVMFSVNLVFKESKWK